MNPSKKMKKLRPGFANRLQDVEIVKPIVFGNIARPITKLANGHTHAWRLYVKPYKNEDMSGYVKQIHFKLHNTYPNHDRILIKPPYEICETGWGEFEVIIKIHFIDARERPVTLFHYMKLHQTPDVVDTFFTKISGIEHLVYEHYEEIVFREPTKLMQHYLTHTQPISSGKYTHYTDFEAKKNQSLEKIREVKEEVQDEIADLVEKIRLAKETTAKFKQELAKVLQSPTP